MTSEKPNPIYKSWAIVGLCALFVNVCYHAMVFAQIKFQLVSDFIPSGIVWDIAKPNIIVALLHFLGFCTGLFLFAKKKYQSATILSLAFFAIGEVYFFFANR